MDESIRLLEIFGKMVAHLDYVNMLLPRLQILNSTALWQHFDISTLKSLKIDVRVSGFRHFENSARLAPFEPLNTLEFYRVVAKGWPRQQYVYLDFHKCFPKLKTLKIALRTKSYRER